MAFFFQNDFFISFMQFRKEKFAFGWPGIPARWTSSAKSAVGTALNPASKIWYSISHGILNEIYYPQVDHACTRDAEFLVTDGCVFFSEEKRHTRASVYNFAEGIPGYIIHTSCVENRYHIRKEIVADPTRDSLLMKVSFSQKRNSLLPLRLFFLVAPHLGNHGNDNTGYYGKYKGFPMLIAERKDVSMAVACSSPWLRGSAGFVGFSDGWQDLFQHKQMMWEFERAENGNIALVAEIDLSVVSDFVISIGFGRNSDEAGMRAMSAIYSDYLQLKKQFIKEWRRWQKRLFAIENFKEKVQSSIFRISASLLKVHESKRHPGGLIASLSIPWGYSKGDDELGGYHLVWPRDMVQVAGGLLAAGAFNEARRVLNYLMITQEEDGHWPQNMWLDGSPYWKGIQMDQTASPILLVDLIHREKKMSREEIKQFWPMIKKAAVFLIKNGPATDQDRWEENAGYSTYTLAVEIAALCVAAEFAALNQEEELAVFFKEVAESWNGSVEWWTYVAGTDLAKSCGVDGYYVRINPRDNFFSGADNTTTVTISNRTPADNRCNPFEMVSPDALALVRLGLRQATDERIINTLVVLDKTLKFEGPGGPLWFRYNRDGYGEHKNGDAFNGTGEGRPWPLLTGERGHYELASGNVAFAKALLKTMENYSNSCGLIPEQIWDSPDIPEKELFFGKPSGAAMPLVWAHAEYLKLVRSIQLGYVFDRPTIMSDKKLTNKINEDLFILKIWDSNDLVPLGRNIRILTLLPAEIMLQEGDGEKKARTTNGLSIGINYADFFSDVDFFGLEIFVSVRYLGNVVLAKQEKKIYRSSYFDKFKRIDSRETSLATN